MIKAKVESIPKGTAHNIIQSIIWGDKEFFKNKQIKSNEQLRNNN